MFGLLLTSEYEYSREQKKQHMPNLEAPEDLLVCQRIKEISPEHYGEPVVVFAPTEQTALAPIPGTERCSNSASAVLIGCPVWRS